MKEIVIMGKKVQYNRKVVRILNSHEIEKEEDMRIFLRVFLVMTGFKSRRSIKSWIREWKCHNWLYKHNLFLSHTQDCDLEENEKLHRLIAYRIFEILLKLKIIKYE